MDTISVAIIGAGLAGLCCARRLVEAGVDCVVFEAADRVGGRVATDRQDGFLLDRGFQVFLTSYPEARRVLDYPALELGSFDSGALVEFGGRARRVADPWRAPLRALGTLFAPVIPLGDLPRVLRLRRAALRRIEPPGSMSASDYLASLGFSARTVERFFRPFFGGVTLDATLSIPAWYFLFLFEMFAVGQATLPAGGMQAIPEQIAAALPASVVRLRAPVAAIGEGWIELAGGERLAVDRTVVATDVASAGALVNRVNVVPEHGTTTLYYAASRSALDEPTLWLNANGDGPVNHLCFPSDVQPTYAPPGAALASVSVLGVPALDDRALDGQVRAQLRRAFGSAVDAWQLLRVDRLPRALPRIGARRGDGVQAMGSIVICGDHLLSPSIQGAMVAGRMAAELMLAASP